MAAVDGYLFDVAGVWDDATRRRGNTTRLRDSYTYTIDWYDGTRRRIGSPRLRDGFLGPVGGGPAPVTTYYRLAAVDTGVGRRVWTSTSIDFASAPPPDLAWLTATLTVLSSWQ